MNSARSFGVAISLLTSLTGVTALPQVYEECTAPTTTTTVTSALGSGEGIPFRCDIVCVAPTSTCSPGEPESPWTTSTITAPGLCAVTLSVGSPEICGGCTTCLSSPATTPAPTTKIVNPGGPRMSVRQVDISSVAADIPILDHNPGGPVLSILTLLTVTVPDKRDEPITEGHGGGPMITVRDEIITEGHGGGPMITARDDPITEGHGGGPMITARDDPITEGHGGGPMITARDEIITEGHGGGPMIMATDTPTDAASPTS